LPDIGPVSYFINKFLFLPGIVKKFNQIVKEAPVYLINYLPLPTSLDFQKRISPDIAAYDCVWDWANDPIAPKMHLCEDEMISACDLVFADSPYLFKKMQTKHDHVFRILPAVQNKLFETNGLNESRIKRSEPVLGYFGNLKVNIDLQLLADLSWKYELHVIGPKPAETSTFSTRTVFHGPVAHQALPELLINVDILVLPYKRSRHTPAVIPAKTFECLATGKPVVVIGLESLQEFSDYFYICRDENELIKNIELAFSEDDMKRSSRLEFARKNDWNIRVKEIEGFFIGTTK
jgi:hypothetical protein